MPEFEIDHLPATDTVALRNVRCSGACRHRSSEECASITQLVFPYRGVYMRHVGSDQAVADANHVLFFNAGEGYQDLFSAAPEYGSVNQLFANKRS